MKSVFTIDYDLTLEGEPRELLEKLNIWIENKIYEGIVNHDSFTIKQRGKGFFDKMNDPAPIDLATTIEGEIQSSKKIKLSAELNSGPKTQVYLIRTFIVFFGPVIAIASFDLVYSTLTLGVTTMIYLFNNRLIRKRVKKDLDGFIWTINNNTSTQLK